MQKVAFEALQVKKDLMHRQIRNQVSQQQRKEQPAAQLIVLFDETLGGRTKCCEHRARSEAMESSSAAESSGTESWAVLVTPQSPSTKGGSVKAGFRFLGVVASPLLQSPQHWWVRHWRTDLCWLRG